MEVFIGETECVAEGGGPGQAGGREEGGREEAVGRGPAGTRVPRLGKEGPRHSREQRGH